MKHQQAVFAVGQHIILPQDFNATCATIESIETHADGGQFATCTNAHDIFGKLSRRVSIPLCHAKQWPEEPRMLRLEDVYA